MVGGAKLTKLLSVNHNILQPACELASGRQEVGGSKPD